MPPLESPQLSSSLPSVIISAKHKFRHWLKQQMVLTNLAMVMGLTGGMMIARATAPPAVHACTGMVNKPIDIQPSETYTLVHRAEAIASGAGQAGFVDQLLAGLITTG